MNTTTLKRGRSAPKRRSPGAATVSRTAPRPSARRGAPRDAVGLVRSEEIEVYLTMSEADLEAVGLPRERLLAAKSEPSSPATAETLRRARERIGEVAASLTLATGETATQLPPVYAEDAAADYAALAALAVANETGELLQSAWEQHLHHCQPALRAYLTSRTELVAVISAGGDLPFRQVETHRRRSERRLRTLNDVREQGLAAIRRRLVPEVAPDARETIAARLNSSLAFQEAMTTANRLIRESGADRTTLAARMRALGFAELIIARALKPVRNRLTGFSKATLSNNLSLIRALERRLSSVLTDSEDASGRTVASLFAESAVDGTAGLRRYVGREVAEVLGCSKSTVRRAAEKLRLGRTIGRVKRFTKGEIERIRKEVRPGPGNPNFGKRIAT